MLDAMKLIQIQSTPKPNRYDNIESISDHGEDYTDDVVEDKGNVTLVPIDDDPLCVIP